MRELVGCREMYVRVNLATFCTICTKMVFSIK